MDDGCVLLVEGDVLIRSPLADYLRDCGYKVFEATDGAEARQILAANAAVIDIVLLNARLPRENGFSVASWIRTNCPTIEVVLVGTVAAAVEKAAQICEDGPNETLPYDHRLIHERIKRLLAARARARGQDDA